MPALRSLDGEIRSVSIELNTGRAVEHLMAVPVVQAYSIEQLSKPACAQLSIPSLLPHPAAAPPSLPPELASLAASPAAASSNIVPASPAAGRGIYRPRQPASQNQARQQ